MPLIQAFAEATLSLAIPISLKRSRFNGSLQQLCEQSHDINFWIEHNSTHYTKSSTQPRPERATSGGSWQAILSSNYLDDKDIF